MINVVIYFSMFLICTGIYLFFVRQFEPDISDKDEIIKAIKVFFLWPLYLIVGVCKEIL